MPPLTRYCLRAAIVCLVAALALGIVLALPGGDWPARAPALRPVFYHLLMAGWATQMIYGVAWWMFPRRSPAEPQTPPLAWVAFLSLNAGLLLRAFAEPAVQLSPSAFATGALIAASALQLLSVVAFAGTAWRRVLAR